MSSSKRYRSGGPLDGPTPNPPLNDILERLTDDRRRVLHVLLDAEGPLSERELADRLHEVDGPPDADVASLRTRLKHVHLPILSAADLVEHDADAGTVRTTDHGVYEDPWFRRLLTTDADLDAVVECLTGDRRRRALAVLEAADDPMTEEALAEEVASMRADESPRTVLGSLHHVHLPKLESVGVIARDDDGRIHRDHCDVEQEWFRVLIGV